MKKGEVKYTYCVWNNKTDTVVAIDETAKRCAELMKIALNTFYSAARHCIKSRINNGNLPRLNFSIMNYHFITTR